MYSLSLSPGGHPILISRCTLAARIGFFHHPKAEILQAGLGLRLAEKYY
jgi:hypothetical protein